MNKTNYTVGEIVNLIGNSSIGFDKGDLLLCDNSEGNGNWFSILDVSQYGLYMSNDDTWQLTELSQEEINRVYSACKHVLDVVHQ